MFCPKCGANVNSDAKFCSECGTDITPKAVPQEPPPPEPQPIPPPAPPPAPPPPQPKQDPVYVQSNYTPPPPPPPQYIPQQVYQSKPAAYSDDRPMSVGHYILTFIILAIPIVGIIMIFVWAFGSSANLNKRNFARAILIMWIIGIVLGIFFAITAASTLSSLLSNY